MIMMLLCMSAVMAIPNSSAVGANQNDIGTSGGDLPDNMSSPTSIPNLIFSGSTSGSGDLVAGTDDYDYLRVSLAANEGIAVELSFNQVDDFDLAIYDSNQMTIDNSISFNPETVTTNSSSQAHGGMVYIEIYGYSYGGVNPAGSYNITIWKFTVGGGSGGGGSNGVAVPNPCVGSNNVGQDILESNDDQATATLASLLPVSCTGLSIGSTNSAGISDEDFFEVTMISGVTYYFNLTFLHANGDIDAQLEDSFGSTLTFNNWGSMSSSSDNEAAEYTATTNFTAYFKVYLYGFGTVTTGNTYDVEISTDNPGGGQSFSTINVTMNNLTDITIEMTGLTVGDTYEYEFHQSFENGINETVIGQLGQGPYSFVATSTTEMANYTISTGDTEGSYSVTANLSDNLGARLNSDVDSIYKEVLVVEATSSTTGDILATNLTIGNIYTIHWLTLDIVRFDAELTNNPSATFDSALSQSLVEQNMSNYTATSSSNSWQVSWSNPTTADEHYFFSVISIKGTSVNLSNLDGYIGSHFDDFIPQLPSAVITNHSFSTTSASNEFSSEGLDLVVGDTYHQQFRVEDPGGADIDYSSYTTYTATSQNMSFGTFYYNTPSISGQYCLYSDLYDSNSVQLIGDYVCLQFIFDDDGDGVANEYDACPNTTPSSVVDTNGCALSQKDTDGDGYNDDIDDFPNDDTQWLDSDGDGFGDNLNGNVPDAFPYDNTQWEDQDGDGYGDNPFGNNSDAFPYDSTQWSDSDGDGYGDNQNGNNPDLWPNDPSQWTDSDGDGYGDNSSGSYGDAFPFDSSQWADSDGDGYGDNVNGNNPDAFPNDGTQWVDSDGDGYGDNQNGNNPDRFVDDSTQWADSDDDGYGDNQNGNNPDAFPSDGTQWVDSDDDGYGDNQNGNNPDRFPNDSTQWYDSDNDGLGDNSNGNNPDLCPGTPFGETVDANGCSNSQKDADQDSVPDSIDACPNTPAGEVVSSNGCSETQLDDDNDGVKNQYDLCSNTPLGSAVDSSGCADSQLDTDNDGIDDSLDQCPTTTPNSVVNGFGCAPDERDSDSDGVNDNIDICSNTPSGENSAANGCSESQTDTDLDGVFDDKDQCENTVLSDMDGDGEFDVDPSGCSPSQYDDDNDMIDNTIDSCPATPNGEQVDSNGCSESQKDEDNDDIWNSDDLCFDTQANRAVDQNGCSEFQKDDDQDYYVNAEDDCPNTPSNELAIVDGCSLSQIDSDNDGVNDANDAFPYDKNETTDSDGDGIPDRLDAYPQDATKSEAESEKNTGGFTYIAIAILVLGVIGALLVVNNRKPPQNNSPFAQANQEIDQHTEANMNFSDTSAKEIPQIENQENQTWEENGVHWSMDPNGALSYFDEENQSWFPYQDQ